MITPGAADKFALSRFDGRNWQIVNHRFPASDVRYAVAWVRETGGDDVQVAWSQPTPLPTVYRIAEDALQDYIRWTTQDAGATRPIPIPHFPPAGQPGSARDGSLTNEGSADPNSCSQGRAR